MRFIEFCLHQQHEIFATTIEDNGVNTTKGFVVSAVLSLLSLLLLLLYYKHMMNRTVPTHAPEVKTTNMQY